MSRGHDRERAVKRDLEARGWWEDPAFLNRFWSKVARQDDGCWLWTAATDKQGYGKIWSPRPEREMLSAHRASYVIANGGVDDALVIDHLCRTRVCVNPAHLEAVPQSVNVQRDKADECVHGHPLDGRRQQTDPDGCVRTARYCKTCDRQRKKVAKAARTRGTQRERAVRRQLEARGWLVVRGAGSLGVADLVALKAGAPSLLVQVKSDAVSPYGHFGPADRRALLEAAERAGAEAQLVWWPPRGEPRWIAADEWPQERAA